MNLIRGPFKLLLLQRERVRVPVPPWCENWKHVETYHKEAINLSNNATNFYYQQFKNIRQISILKTPFVSTPFRESKFNSTIWRNFCGSSFRFLTHSRYNFKRDCERRVKFGFEILVLERKICYREGKWNWLLSPPWLRMEQQNLCQIMAGRSLFLFTKFPGIMRNGREEAGGSSYRKRKYEFTRRKLRNHET